MDREGLAPIVIIIVVAALLAIGGGILYSVLDKPQIILPERQTQPPAAFSSATNGASAAASSSGVSQNVVARFTDDRNIAAQSLAVINATATFTLKDLPDAQFTILNIVEATGGLPNPVIADCGAYGNGSFIFVSKRQPGASPPGFCIPDRGADGSQDSVVAVDLEIVNNGSGNVSGGFLRAFYTQTIDGKESDRLADQGAYSGGTGPFSSRRTYEIFKVPAGENEIRLVFGNYGGLGQLSGEGLFSQSEGGFIVNFSEKTVSPLPG